MVSIPGLVAEIIGIVSSIGLLVPLRQSSIPRKILGLMAGA